MEMFFEFDGNRSIAFAYEGVSSKPSTIAKMYELRKSGESESLTSILLPIPDDAVRPPYLYPTVDMVSSLGVTYEMRPEDVLKAILAAIDRIGTQDNIDIDLLTEALDVLAKAGKVSLKLSDGRVLVQMSSPDSLDFSITTF